jgi:lipopolysaccharide export system permease protein
VILARHLGWRTWLASLAAFAGVLTIFLAVDVVDNASVFEGPGWVLTALELYANKAAVVAHQIAPAALLLGAAIAVSGLRQTREWTAMRSVGLGPWRVALPVVGAVALVSLALLALHEVWGVRAAQRAEEIQVTRFARGGAYRRWQATQQPKRWFRGADGRHVYHLRGVLPGGGFERVTVLELSDEFRLIRRIDAGRMEPAPGGAWRLAEVEERHFTPEGARFERSAWREYRFDEPPGSFDLRPGRPSQMSLPVLAEQIAVRGRLGQPSIDFAIERANRVAYPFAAVSGALVAVALALRRRRRGHLSSAVLEAVGLSLALWGLQGICLGLGLSGRLPAALAAWLPNLVFLSVGALAVRRTA